MNYTETRDVLIAVGIPAERLPEGRLDVIDLSGADLSWADLSEANGPFTSGYLGGHHAVAAGGYICIGCERHTYEVWLADYESIGRRHEYSDEMIADYGAWIALAVARQRRIEKPDPVTASHGDG